LMQSIIPEPQASSCSTAYNSLCKPFVTGVTSTWPR
jgi:hypothetical protein